MVNLGLVPRSRSGCWICRHVTAVEDVTVRLFDAELRDLPPKGAIGYMQSIGHAAKPATWQGRVAAHRKHVRRSIEKPAAYTPLGAATLVPVAPEGGLPSWVRAPDRAIDLGMDALTALKERMPVMEDTDLVSVARLGITAASKMGDWHAKGRQLAQMDRVFDFIADAGLDDDGD